MKTIKRYLVPQIEMEYKKATQIQTAMKLTCAILNSRPLCSYYENGQDHLLTPNHLVHGVPLELLLTKSRGKNTTVRNYFERRQLVFNIMRERLAREYLISLRKRTTKTQRVREFKEGDLVAYEDKVKSPEWPVANIVKIYPGKDKQTRMVLIKKWGKESPEM